MIDQIANKLLDGYINDYTVVAEEHSNNAKEKRQYTLELVENDLLDKNFNITEINEILNKKMSTETMYKFTAYAVAIFGEYENTQELKDRVKEYMHKSKEIELREEELSKITQYRNIIDF